MMKESLKLETEKDMIKRKISNFKNTIEKESPVHPDAFSPKSKSSTIKINRKDNDNNPENHKKLSSIANKEFNTSKSIIDYADYVSDNDCVSTYSNFINLNDKKNYLESEDERVSMVSSIDNNFLNDINSDVENNVIK